MSGRPKARPRVVDKQRRREKKKERDSSSSVLAVVTPNCPSKWPSEGLDGERIEVRSCHETGPKGEGTVKLHDALFNCVDGTEAGRVCRMGGRDTFKARRGRGVPNPR